MICALKIKVNVKLTGKYQCCGLEAEFDSKYFLEPHEFVAVRMHMLREYDACHKMPCPKCGGLARVKLNTEPILEDNNAT